MIFNCRYLCFAAPPPPKQAPSPRFVPSPRPVAPSPRPVQTPQPDEHRPLFQKQLTNQCLQHGGTAYFECKVDGYPPPEILWTRRGHPLVDKTRSALLSTIIIIIASHETHNGVIRELITVLHCFYKHASRIMISQRSHETADIGYIQWLRTFGILNDRIGTTERMWQSVFRSYF